MIETMVVIAIVAILTALAAPSIRNLIESTGVANSVNAFIGSVSYARSEALRRGLPVSMCRSVNADTSGTPSCSSGDEWQVGWIIFVDFKGNGTFDIAQGDTLLRVDGPVTKNGVIGQRKSKTLQFAATGLLTSGANRFQFNAPSGAQPLERYVCVGFGGRTRLIKDTAAEDCES